jgi:serine protease AprX
MKKCFLVTTWCLILALSAIGQNKIESTLLTKREKAFSALLYLGEQADLSLAPQYKGKVQKANYVYDQKIAVSRRTQAAILSYLKLKNIPHQSYYIVNMIKVTTDLATLEDIASTFNEIAIIAEDRTYTAQKVEIDNSDSGSRSMAIEWGITNINADDVWALGYKGANVIIGGQDTGYEWDDAALKLKYRGWNPNTNSAAHNYNWHDAIDMNVPPNTGTNPCGYNLAIPCDDNNHGTHTMGTMVGEEGANQIGVAPDAEWIGCRNMDRGYGNISTYLECFEWFLAPYPYQQPAMADPAMMPHVINNSWGCPPVEGCTVDTINAFVNAIDALRTAGCVVVVSAGNSGSNCSTVADPPAIYAGSFSVGAYNSSNAIAGFSSRGPVTIDGSGRIKPDIAAPGVSVRSCIRGVNAYSSFSGTSMAGPHVAGVVALMISANPALDGEVEKIEQILEQTAVHTTSTQNCSTPGTTIPNNTFGYGRLDALAAVNMALKTQYQPYVQSSSIYWVSNPLTGLVISNANNQKYRMTVTNNGVLNKTLISNTALASTVVNDGSIYIDNTAGGIVLTSPDGNKWKISINLAQNVVATSYTIGSKFLEVKSDFSIEDGIKGLVVNNGSSCYLINATTMGDFIAVPSTCP